MIYERCTAAVRAPDLGIVKHSSAVRMVINHRDASAPKRRDIPFAVLTVDDQKQFRRLRKAFDILQRNRQTLRHHLDIGLLNTVPARIHKAYAAAGIARKEPVQREARCHGVGIRIVMALNHNIVVLRKIRKAHGTNVLSWSYLLTNDFLVITLYGHGLAVALGQDFKALFAQFGSGLCKIRRIMREDASRDKR
jgi:hypothetical protein